jgi:hypothetical protein
VILEIVGMTAFALGEYLYGLQHPRTNWPAVYFVLAVVPLWAAGLGLAVWGLGRCRRWAFTPIVFTQMMIGVISLSLLAAATPGTRIVLGLILTLAVVVLLLAFSRPIRVIVTAPG